MTAKKIKVRFHKSACCKYSIRGAVDKTAAKRGGGETPPAFALDVAFLEKKCQEAMIFLGMK